MKKKSQPLFGSVLRFLALQLKNPRKRLLVELAAVVLLVGIIISIVLSGRSAPTDDLKEGLAYIQSLEEADTAPVEKEIKEIKKQERKEALESGELDVWQQFNDSAVLGDSRAVGFSYHGFIEENRVFAEGGATIRDIPKYVDSLKTLNPSSIFLCFGLNDISIGYWDTVEEYIKELDEMLSTLHENLPDATVYVNSTIPAIDPAFEKSSKWRNISDWNVEVKEHCEEENIPYIDINETVEEHKDLYDPDGIHMRKEFYPFWGIDMVTEVNENE